MRTMRNLIFKLESIIKDDLLTWDQKYDLVFSPMISKALVNAAHESGVFLEWYDPDTSYKEDVMAFFNAVMNQKEVLIKASELVH